MIPIATVKVLHAMLGTLDADRFKMVEGALDDESRAHFHELHRTLGRTSDETVKARARLFASFVDSLEGAQLSDLIQILSEEQRRAYAMVDRESIAVVYLLSTIAPDQMSRIAVLLSPAQRAGFFALYSGVRDAVQVEATP